MNLLRWQKIKNNGIIINAYEEDSINVIKIHLT